MNKFRGTKLIGSTLGILLLAGLLVNVGAHSEEPESVIVKAKGQGEITTPVDEAKITNALVVLRQNGTALITITTDLQLQLQATWKANPASPENIRLTITGGALDGDIEGSGTLVLTDDRKSLKRLTIKATSADGREINVSFVADDSDSDKK